MNLDTKKLIEEISKVAKIKASHISDGEVNEMLRKSMKDNRTRPSGLDIEAATNIFEKQGYRINPRPEKGYVNNRFGYRVKRT